MSSRRSLVLDALRRRGWATAGELARSLGVTVANVRHHLDELLAASLVEVVALRPSGGRGRPVRVYALSSGVVGDNLEALAKALLEVYLAGEEREENQDKLIALVQRLIAQGGNPPSEAHLSLRLKRTVERLNAFHYCARWEASAQGPRLILGRCPYRRLADHHPELCWMDTHLIATLIGLPTEQVLKRTAMGEGPPACVFLVKIPPTRSSAETSSSPVVKGLLDCPAK